MLRQKGLNKTLMGFLAVLGWFALIAQFYLIINSGKAPIPELVIRYFSYFTILTNILVATCCICLFIASRSRWASFFSSTKTYTAIAVYIVVVGIVYNIILRFLWQPTGLQQVVDEILHTIVPVLFFLSWMLYAATGSLKWKDSLPWLIYPTVYCVYVLIRGAASGFYPYPFIDLDKLGLYRTTINIVALTSGFLFLSLLFIAISKWMGKKGSKAL